MTNQVIELANGDKIEKEEGNIYALHTQYFPVPILIDEEEAERLLEREGKSFE